MNLIFIGIFQHAGLALAIGLGACINAALLFYHLKKGKIFKLDSGWFQFIGKILISTFIMSITLFLLNQPIEVWLDYSAFFRVIYLTFLILSGALVYFVALKCCRLDFFKFLKKTHN